MADIMAIAKSLESIANAQANVDDELEMREAEREEVFSYLTGRVDALTEEVVALRGQVRDEHSQHMRYNKYKKLVQAALGEGKKATTDEWSTQAHRDAQGPQKAFIAKQQKEAEQREEADVAERAAHEARMKKIRDDGAKRRAERDAAAAAEKPKAARKKAEPKERKDAKPRTKTAQQLYCWEDATKAAYQKAKEARADKSKPFPSPVAWGNARFEELPPETQEEYKAQAKQLRQEAGLKPVVPRATPRTKSKETNVAKQATLQGIVKKKKESKEAQEDAKEKKRKKKMKRASDDDSDDDDNDDREEAEADGDSDDAMDASKDKAREQDDEEEEEEQKGEEDDDDEDDEDDDEDASPATKKRKKDEPAAKGDDESDEEVAAPAEAANRGAESSDDE